MLKKSRRLTSAEVSQVLKTGKGASFGFVRIKYTPRGPQAKVSRFAIVVSKKVLKKATDRNHLRRQAYSLLKGVDRIPAVDAALFISSGELSFGQLQSSIEAALASMREKRA